MKQRLFELHVPGERFGTFYIVEMPSPGEPDFYRQAVSFKAFCTRELKRALPENTGDLDWVAYTRTIKYCSCSVHEPRPGESIARYLPELGEDPDTVPVCQGIWDFYEKIGYDRSTQKYI
jgi:hypothetical protein